MYCRQLRRAARGRGVPDRRPQRERLEDERHREDPDRDRGRVDLVRVADLVVALVDREQAAEREQHDRDDERPEVPHPPVAELVQLVRRLLGLTPAEEEQALVAGVGDRVDRLRQQRRRAGDQEARRTWSIAMPMLAANAAAIAPPLSCPSPAMRAQTS